jgi:hypothetical protein
MRTNHQLHLDEKQIGFLLGLPKCKFNLFVFLVLFQTGLTAQPGTLSPHIISYISNTSLSVRDVHTDCEGNIIYVGGTGSKTFVISPNTISTIYNGGASDVFLVKVDSNGNALWSTLLGGYLYDRAYAVEIDHSGYIYVAGRAGPGLVTSECALQKSFAGDNNPNSAYGIQDGFITKITPDGSTIVWSTYIGGGGRGFVRDIDLDSEGNIWAGISNASPDFPHITNNALQPVATASMNAALIKLSSNGDSLLYGTFLSDGVSASAGPTTVRVDKQDNVFFLCHGSVNAIPVTPGVFQPLPAGNNDFVLAKFNANGGLIFCSFLGGPGNEEVETHSLEVDTAGNAIVAAYTYGAGYPVVGNVIQTTFGGVRDGVVSVIAADGSALLASTYLGGSQIDELQGVAVDRNNHIYVAGRTASADFPVSANNAFQSTLGGNQDGHISVLSADLSSVLYATFIGGSNNEDLRCCHVDEQGKVHSGGNTASTNYPIFNAFNSSLTGSLTGTAVVLEPEILTIPEIDCAIMNGYADPCLNSSSSTLPKPDQSLRLFPNPVGAILKIPFPVHRNMALMVQIYTISGMIIKELTINQTTHIDVSDWPSGPYVVHYLHATIPSMVFIKE